jgi:hypothetical protein
MNLESIVLNEKFRAKATCCMTPFMENVQNQESHRDLKLRIAREWAVTANGHEVSLGRNNNALELDRGNGCTTCKILKIT